VDAGRSSGDDESVSKNQTWQIRDDRFGLCLIEAESAQEALRVFVALYKTGNELDIATQEDGDATLFYRGRIYRAVGGEEAKAA